MRKINIRGFNNHYCKKHKLELIQGDGYLYWMYLGDEVIEPPESIYVATFSQLTHDVVREKDGYHTWTYNPNIREAKNKLADAVEQLEEALNNYNKKKLG